MTEQEYFQSKVHLSTVGTLVYLLFGPIVWAFQFAAVYMVHALLCTIGASGMTASALIFGVSLVAAVCLTAAIAAGDQLAAGLGVAAGARGRPAYDGIFRGLAVLSLIAVVWSGVTVFVVAAC